jgi:gelsolin
MFVNMAEEGRLSWKESNLADIWSDLDHKIKQAAAEGEEAWRTLARRRESKYGEWSNSRSSPDPRRIGCFYKGDSYIVLNSWIAEGQDKLNHDLYIWIGSESSQDEYGMAAYKMVEADDFVGGIAIQHREVEGHESPKFKDLFGNLTYWTGGIASGFNHVEPTEEVPNLYMVRGTEKNMTLT